MISSGKPMLVRILPATRPTKAFPAQVTSGTVDFAKTAVLEGVLPSPQADRRDAGRGGQGGEAPVASGGEATVTEASDTRLTILANAAADGWLILGDSYHPLWRARVDGDDVPVYRADYVLRGVRVTRGAHKVEFRFDTRPLRDWGAVSLVALLLALAGLCVRVERQRHH